MSKAIRTLAVIILVGYVTYVASFTVSGAIAANQGMPSDKVPDPLVMAAWAVPGIVGFLISGLTLTLGILAAISANRRGHRAGRVICVALGVLGAPGPNIGGAFILGGLLSFGGPRTGVNPIGAALVLLGLLFLVVPIVLAISALIQERHPLSDVAPRHMLAA
jgi:hypothetical protein